MHGGEKVKAHKDGNVRVQDLEVRVPVDWEVMLRVDSYMTGYKARNLGVYKGREVRVYEEARVPNVGKVGVHRSMEVLVCGVGGGRWVCSLAQDAGK